MGRNNLEFKYNVYKLGENINNSSQKERNLGVVIDRTGKASEQCIIAVKHKYYMLGMNKRNISYRSKYVIMLLYKVLVRSQRQFCVQA